MTDTATLTARRLSPVAGAEIPGVDLAEPLPPSLKDAITKAFLEHHLLVFRDQRLTADQQHALTSHFGPIEEHVARRADGSRSPVVHRVHNLDEDSQPTSAPRDIGNYVGTGGTRPPRPAAGPHHAARVRLRSPVATRRSRDLGQPLPPAPGRAQLRMDKHRRVLQRTVVRGTVPF
jgi:Taurine catabolism dioxygenase TauD, TfdA family